MTTVDDLHYGDIIEHVSDHPGPGERFMVVRVEEELVWAINLVQWDDGVTPEYIVGGYDTGLGGNSFRVIEHKP